MADVHDAFAGAGCENVTAVMQSGNILFETAARSCGRTMEDVRRKLRRLLGEEPQVMVRTTREIADLIAAAPFAAYEPSPRIKFYVSFFNDPPRKIPPLPLVSVEEALEAIAVTRRHVLVVSRPKRPRFFGLPNNFIEDQLGVPATTRNWSTLVRIAEAARRRRAG